MNGARTRAWIMYALAGASGAGPASFVGISQVADGINHAVPSYKEMQEALRWLMENDIALKVGSKYQLTKQGLEFMAAAQAQSNTMSGVWASLTESLSSVDGKL